MSRKAANGISAVPLYYPALQGETPSTQDIQRLTDECFAGRLFGAQTRESARLPEGKARRLSARSEFYMLLKLI